MENGDGPMVQRACRSVGIDLGTTYSSLSYVDTQMMPRVVADSSGQTVMPSVVYFSDDGIIVGEMALQQAKVAADRVVQFIKVHMGDPWRRELGGRVQSPESISAMIVGQLVKEADPQIGEIPSAVITVPAYFTEKRRRATQQAGEIAGLQVIGTLNEPMAATLAYGLHHHGVEQNAVVYDLGGGTFDVTVVRISPNELEELATNGNRQLGGRDWDQSLIDFVAEDFQRAHGLDPREIPQALQDLVLECEAAKRRLGRLSKTTVRLHAAGCDHQVEVSREAFEEMTDPLLRATKLTTEIALADAGLTWEKIARVVLVGGATHMPAVRPDNQLEGRCRHELTAREAIEAALALPDFQAIGFRAMVFLPPPSHPRWADAWTQLAERDNLRVVYLRRRDRLAQYASMQIAEQTGVYHPYDNDPLYQPENQPTITIDPQQFLEWTRHRDDLYAQRRRQLAGKPSLDLDYETLTREWSQTLASVQDFLGVARHPLDPGKRKQQARPLSEVISNYQALRDLTEAS